VASYLPKEHIISRVAIQSIERNPVFEQTCCLSHLSVGLSIQWVNGGKTADWIWMLFGVVSGVGRGMGVLDGVEIVEGEGTVLGVNVGHSIATNGELWHSYSLP